MNQLKCTILILLGVLIFWNYWNLLADDKPGSIYVNSIDMKFAYIPAGSFLMGSPFDEKGHQSDEFPHQVTLTHPFRISITEVTQFQWKAVVNVNRSNFSGDGLPVEKVGWQEAVLFCKKLSEKEVKTYRLPTEAEWEYACRSGSTKPFSGSGNLDQIAWYADNSLDTTHPVGSKLPNAWGLYDMHGNVSEWCLDSYNPEYPNTIVNNPTGPEAGTYRVIRGGAWDSFPVACRSAARSSAPASYQFKQTGFRVVMEIPE